MKHVRTLLAVVLLMLGAATFAPRVHAAEEEKPKHEHVSEASRLNSGELEQAEEGGTAAFKHSSSVKFVAKLTGLSTENAYWLCIIGNFVIVAGVLGWALKKNLPAVFRNRTASIQQSMAEAVAKHLKGFIEHK